ncbi:hypothetical protein ABIF65_009252 [Bradyrhizobium japonicum]
MGVKVRRLFTHLAIGFNEFLHLARRRIRVEDLGLADAEDAFGGVLAELIQICFHDGYGAGDGRLCSAKRVTFRTNPI